MIQLNLFGHPRVSRDGVPLDSVLKPGARADLLLYVAETRDVSREKLVRLFWPDSDDSRHALSQALYALRQSLGQEWVQSASERVVLLPAAQVDTHSFEQLGAAHDYPRALETYTGPFLADWKTTENQELERWVDGRRNYYQRKYRQYVRAQVTALKDAGAFDEALSCTWQATQLEPEEDEFHRFVIELLVAAGRRAEALGHFESYERLMAAADLKPLDDIVKLVNELRAQGVEQPIRPVIRTSPVTPATSSAPIVEKPIQRRLPRHAAIAAGTLLVLTGIAMWRLPGASSAGMADADLLPEMVAILPFAELASAERAAAADSFRARLAADLRRNPQIQIADLARTDREARNRGGLHEIAASLQALVLVGGSLTSSDSAVTLTMQMWDGGTGNVINSKRWETREHAAAGTLAEDAANYLNSQLLPILRTLAYRRETRSVEGWQLFNSAWEHYRNSSGLAASAKLEAGLRALFTADSLASAAERADEEWVAPTLLRVQIAQRAMMWSRHPAAQRTPAEIKTWAEAAIAQGDRALERAPGNIDALELRGIAKYDYWTYLAGEQTRDDHALLRSAERDLQDAAAADARRSRARVYLADIFHARAQFKEEKAMALLALDADPLSARDPMIIYRIAIASFYLKQPAQALRMCREGQQRFPNYVPFRFCELFVLAHANEIPPDVARAGQIVDHLASPENAPAQRAQVPLFLMLAANVLARAGLRDSAQAVIARASAEAPGSVSLMAPEAAAWTRLGEHKRAIDILEADAAIDPVWIKATLLNPSFDPIRNHPRFQSLASKYLRQP